MPDPVPVDLDLSNVTIGSKRLTWQELAEHNHEQLTKAREWGRICADLDRCEHGRHEGDNCSGCGGPSHGNPLIRKDRHIGFTISGHRIVMPPRETRHDASAWGSPR